MNVSLAIAAGIMYGLSSIGWMYTALTLFGPLPIACVLGAVSGRMAEAMAMGAAIQSIYLGLIAPGGNTPADANLATCVGVSIALLGNLDYNTAVTLAVPVGLLGALLTILKYIIAGMFVEPAEEACDNCDYAKLWRCTFLWNAIIRFAMGFGIVFMAVVLGVDAIQGILNAIPEWIQHGLSVAGGMLPIMGFGLTIYIIGQPKFIPLFIIGYFMVQYGGLSVMAIAIFGVCISLFLAFLDTDRDNKYAELYGELEDDFGFDDEEEQEDLTEKKVLTPADVNMFALRWQFFCEVPHSYQRMQAQALATAMAPMLRKMYPDDDEKYASALRREMMYFNTEGVWGSSVLGVALAMEEEQAITQSMSEEQATASINGVKVGFMGPFAGVGDTVDWATLQYLFIGIGLPYAFEGNPAGVLPILGFVAVTYAECFFFTNMGYNLGRTALGSLFTSGLIDRLIDTSCMIGMMMMGALGNTYVHISLASEEAQATLDKIIPGLLPLIAIFALYLILQFKTQNMPMITLGIVAISLIGSLIGLL